MQTIALAFDPRTRILTADSEGAGTVIDDCAVTFSMDPVDGCIMDLVCGVTICDGGRRYRPALRFTRGGTVKLPHQVLQACTGGTLPIALRLTYEDRRVVGSRQLILKVDVVPDAYGDMAGAYGDYLMLRNDSWAWVCDWTYSMDSVAIYDGELWRSLTDDNQGNIPSEDSQFWEKAVKDGISLTAEWDGDVLVITDRFGEHRSPSLTGPQGPVGPQGVQGPRGEPFAVAAVFASVADMEAAWETDGVAVGAFVLIETGDVEDPENSRLYVKTDRGYSFLTDMSGQQGIQGPEGPQGIQGPVGPQGPQGDIGPQGPQGLPAESSVPGELVARYIGDGSNIEFDVLHRLGTKFPFWQVQDLSGENPEYIQVYGYAKDESTLHLVFSSPPSKDSVRVMVSSGLGTGKVAPYVYETPEALSEWRIEHNLGYHASFTVTDTAGTVYQAAEVIVDENTTIEYLADPMRGRAIER